MDCLSQRQPTLSILVVEQRFVREMSMFQSDIGREVEGGGVVPVEKGGRGERGNVEMYQRGKCANVCLKG